MTDSVVVQPTARARIVRSEANHVQLEYKAGTFVTVDLSSRRMFDFKCSGEGCNYEATWDVIDIVYDPGGATRYPCPVELLDYKETVH